MKDYKKFLEEVTIKGNPGVPGEDKNSRGEDPYLSNIENRAKRRLNITPEDMPYRGRPSRKQMELGHKIGQLMQSSMQYVRGKENELSELATKVFLNIYQELIDRYEIEVDIKIIRPGRVKDWMDSCEDCEPAEPPKMKEIEDEEVKKEIHKRKIDNLVIQGEAKNTKHILHSEEVKDGLKEIYGEETAKVVFDLWDETTKVADQLDWIIPTEVRSQMMEEAPDFMAGACFVDWQPKKKEEEEEEVDKEEEDKEKSFFAKLFGKDDDEIENDIQESSEETPIIRARGIDFPMLLHESVKGLFEILSLGGLPEDKRTAELSILNTGIEDEPEDWKYGPEIASDIRDFINLNDKVSKHPNVREEVYKILIDRNTMSTDDFLKLIKGILSKKEEARIKVDKIIDEAIKNISDYKDSMDKYNQDMEKYNRDMEDWKSSSANVGEEGEEEDDEISKIINKPVETDYSKMSKSQIQELIDDALDRGDIETLQKLTPFIKESLEWRIYESEINRLVKNNSRSK